jgi:hypothetical protein
MTSTDVLVITGPVSQQQLDQPALSPGTECIYTGSGAGTGSTAMGEAVAAWLGGRTLREKVLEIQPDLRRLGVIWFSAGHGGVQAMLKAGTEPEDAQAWLCLDGLYTAWHYQAQWATKLALAASESTTTMLATASVSTPGQYADSLSAWSEVMSGIGVTTSDEAVKTALGLDLPEPKAAWQKGALLVCGYPNIDHAHQTPAMRQGMANWWNAVRAAEPGSGFTQVDEGEGEDGSSLAGIAVGIGAAAIVSILLAKWAKRG